MEHNMVVGHYSSSAYKGPGKEYLNPPSTIKFEYSQEEDPVNKPEHYQYSPIQPIDVIDAWELDFYLGSVIKYISRFKKKGKPLEDLEKALWFLNKELEILRKKHEKTN
jgi:hypothetical protein